MSLASNNPAVEKSGQRTPKRQGSDHGELEVIIVSGRHSFSCSMSLGGQRVLDVLNDKSTAFLRISDTTLSRIGQTESFGELQDAVVAKSSIDCVLIENDVHEAPIRRHHSLVNKHAFATFVLLPDHEICGMTMWAIRPDPLVLLASDAPSFFPASPATLWGTSLREHCASTVAFINKASVSMISIGKRAGS
jgi:hypothetical protein